MKPALEFRAVIFDLDGLVLDSEASYFAAWQQTACRMGYRLSQAFCESLSGLHGTVINQRLIECCGPDFDLSLFSRLSGQIWLEQVGSQGIPIRKGFHTLLGCLRELGLPYGLATNSRRVDAERCLAWAGIDDLFSHVVCRDDVANPKPAPDLFVKTAELLGMCSAECLVLEDSPTGVAAAVAAGSPCIYVPSCLPADPLASEQANLVLKDLAQVADFVSARSDHSL
ncbi:MAG: HAD family hydrolase [Gammaproteobacteria bacterium]